MAQRRVNPTLSQRDSTIQKPFMVELDDLCTAFFWNIIFLVGFTFCTIPLVWPFYTYYMTHKKGESYENWFKHNLSWGSIGVPLLAIVRHAVIVPLSIIRIADFLIRSCVSFVDDIVETGTNQNHHRLTKHDTEILLSHRLPYSKMGLSVKTPTVEELTSLSFAFLSSLKSTIGWGISCAALPAFLILGFGSPVGWIILGLTWGVPSITGCFFKNKDAKRDTWLSNTSWVAIIFPQIRTARHALNMLTCLFEIVALLPRTILSGMDAGTDRFILNVGQKIQHCVPKHAFSISHRQPHPQHNRGPQGSTPVMQAALHVPSHAGSSITHTGTTQRHAEEESSPTSSRGLFSGTVGRDSSARGQNLNSRLNLR